jgi:subtilisin
VNRKIVVFSKDLERQVINQNSLPGLPGILLKTLPLVNAAVMLQDPSTSTEEITKVAGVAKVIDDVKLYAVEDDIAAQASQVLPWGVDRIDAEKVWPKSSGNNIKVAVVDTGIDINHPDMKVYGGINTINPQKGYKDDNGHGTHVAGIIAALSNKIGVIGVACRAQLYAVKVLGANGSGYLSDAVEGLEWCINNGMHVVNMSVGHDTDVELLHEAIKAVYNAGIFIVAAAGNSGPDSNSVIYPAKYPEVAAVSASDQHDSIAYFSSRGPEVDLTAPGVNIYSTYRNRTYMKLSGTSMAAPHVSGTAALVLAKKGMMKPDVLLNHLKETALDINHEPEEQGAGLVDAYSAVLN